ncbi:penicillin-binding transpeptidase domain-containing protein [Virgibacillus sp. YIM 98842]|jgi:penicillin-binding protein|uniref:penicillin-binding transpeptidase domain-containing protein n=1 Tax=Virgibacillus sp. YIM 98842 TaxID=2663533 RepID=UPI0013DC0F73|nr:penicillin-binding transpeptidase domain-containing protein [Virgibacillus sp. YIM 98842]
MRKLFIFFSVIIITLLAACSEDQATPNESFETYVNQWNNMEFEKMYSMLTPEAKETYAIDQYADRYNKIYEDLAVSDLHVSFDPIADETLENAMEDGTATLPFTVDMETMAGEINFSYEATLHQLGEEEEEMNWFIAWDPGFIFPDLKDGGEISIETTNPQRGEILDRNQMPLAINDTVYEIGFIPESMGDNPEQSIDQAAELLGMSVENIETALNADWVEPDLFVPLKQVSVTDEETLNQLFEVPGITNRELTGRVYPAGEAAAHLVGYIGDITAEELEEAEPGKYSATDVIGKRGLEQWYEDRLKGERGVTIVVEKEDEEEVVLAETPVQDGENITLTIDINLQEKIFNAYEEEDSGTAAAINPVTGETLALVSSPAFDPNEILYGTNADLWDSLQNDEQSPLINRFSATFAPGSVIKPLTAAIGLANGSLDPDEGFEIEGKTWSNGEAWGDYEVRRVSESSGPVDLMDAMVRSDNIYFAMQGVEMGGEAFVSGMESIGFGEELPYEYPVSASTVSASGEMDDEVMLANASYGQGQLEMSALHLAAGYTMFINEGNMVKPTFLSSEETGQIWQENVLSPEQADLIADSLRAVVTDGTATVANEADFPISGKTGTAELKLSGEDDSAQENGWFVGYPTEDPDILIAMMVEETQDRGGSSYTAEKVTDLLIDIY